MLDQKCTPCHQPSAPDVQAAKFDLSPDKAWQTLIGYADVGLAVLRVLFLVGVLNERISYVL